MALLRSHAFTVLTFAVMIMRKLTALNKARGSGDATITAIVAACCCYRGPRDAKERLLQYRHLLRLHPRETAILDLERRHIRLEGSSNLRDIGGYRAADGRRVKWGLVFRSGALWGLTEADWRWIGEQGFAAVCDLRSDAEREIAPTRWQGGPAPDQVDTAYGSEHLFGQRNRDRPAGLGALDGNQYTALARLLAPSFRGLFHALLSGRTPAIIHCTAGQDRTGLAVGLLLTALKVDRATIYGDYLMSTELRRPEFEMDRSSLEVLAKSNMVAAFYAKDIARRGPAALTPRQLVDETGAPLLERSFVAIERTWGSIDAYMDEVLDFGANERRALQDRLLEVA